MKTLVGVGERLFGTNHASVRPPGLDEHRDAILRELDGIEGEPVG